MCPVLICQPRASSVLICQSLVLTIASEVDPENAGGYLHYLPLRAQLLFRVPDLHVCEPLVRFDGR